MRQFEFIHKKKLTKKQKQHYIKIYEGLVKLIKEECSKKGENQEQRIKALQATLITVVSRYPELLYMKSYEGDKDAYSTTFQQKLNIYGLIDVLENICQDVNVCELEAFGHISLLFSIVIYKNFDFAKGQDEKRFELVKSLLKKHPELLTFRDGRYNENLGMYLIRELNADNKQAELLIPIIKMFIEDPDACRQRDGDGYNLGMLAAKYKIKELFDLAVKNAQARKQKNFNGDTMEIIAKNNGIQVPTLTDKEIYFHYREILDEKIDDICK